MKEKGLNWSRKESWCLTNEDEIASHFGYEPNDLFREALSKFIEGRVNIAKFTLFIGSLAQSYFRNFQPPLTKVKK